MKNGDEIAKRLSFRLECIDNTRLLASSLLNLVNNLLKEFIKLNVNTETMIKKCKNCRVKYKYCNSFVEYKNIKDNLTEYKCLCCNKNYQQKFDEKLAS